MFPLSRLYIVFSVLSLFSFSFMREMLEDGIKYLFSFENTTVQRFIITAPNFNIFIQVSEYLWDNSPFYTHLETQIHRSLC